ncbi:hypothetical protein [Actinomadura macrotermitis]|uniref:hypothetical protein n=1 Tax=Actinomadura macrotermitis TaxID=2585200 RepID=UPI00188693D1|nr:hypothetical protein [Actinomadura macrotermitis]
MWRLLALCLMAGLIGTFVLPVWAFLAVWIGSDLIGGGVGSLRHSWPGAVTVVAAPFLVFALIRAMARAC